MDIVVRPVISAGARKLATNLSGDFSRKVFNVINNVGKRAVTALEQSVGNWKDPPHFIYFGDASSGEIQIFTTDKRFLWVDDGVIPHTITAHRRVMVFPATYAAKSKPNRILRGSGGYGGDLVFAKRVNHPGIKARNISKRVAEQTQRNLTREVNAVIKTLQ